MSQNKKLISTKQNDQKVKKTIKTVSAWALIPTSKTQLSNFFCPPPQALKNLISPPRQAKSPNNSNMLYMFNNNTYTDFRRAYNHVLITFHYSCSLTEPKCHKTKH